MDAHHAGGIHVYFFDLWLGLACCSLPEATLKVCLQIAICAVCSVRLPGSKQQFTYVLCMRA